MWKFFYFVLTLCDQYILFESYLAVSFRETAAMITQYIPRIV